MRLMPLVLVIALICAAATTSGCSRGADLDGTWKPDGPARDRGMVIHINDASISGNDGTNAFTGTVHRDGSNLTVTDVRMTLMAAVDPLPEQDALGHFLMGKPVKATVTDDVLTLRDGQHSLVLHRA